MMTVAGDPRVTIATSVPDVEALRPIWHSIEHSSIDADIDYFLSVVRTKPGVISPYVVHAKTSDGRDLLVVARVENARMPIKIGPISAGSFALRRLAVAFDGILGPAYGQEIEFLVGVLESALDKRQADVLSLRHFDAAGQLAAHFNNAIGWLRRRHGLRVTPHWMADVGVPWSKFIDLRSAKSRYHIRSVRRNFERDFEGRLRLDRFHRVEQMDVLLRDLASVASRSYQAGLGVAFNNSLLQHELIRLGLECGRYQAWILYVDDLPIAFWDGNAYGGVFASGTTGFDPAFAKHSAGRYAMLRMLEDLCGDPSIATIDFGAGDAEYKAAYGECRRQDVDITIFASRPMPIAVNLLLSAAGGFENLAGRLVERLRIRRWLRHAWIEHKSKEMRRHAAKQ